MTVMEKKDIISAISSYVSDAVESLLTAKQYSDKLGDDRELQWVYWAVKGATQAVYGLWLALNKLQSKMREKEIEEMMKREKELK